MRSLGKSSQRRSRKSEPEELGRERKGDWLEVWGERDRKAGASEEWLWASLQRRHWGWSPAGVGGEHTEDDASWKSWGPDCLDHEQSPLQIRAENRER